MILLKKFFDEYNLANIKAYDNICIYNSIIFEWNSKVNVISRKNKSIENIVLNSIFFLTKYDFNPKARVLDIGTGGGFPGIPLKIIYPEICITLCDSIQKKINVVDDVIKRMNLKNALAVCSRAEDLKKSDQHLGRYDYIVSKSVAPLSDIYKWGKDLLNKNGLFLCIKGGNMTEEMKILLKRNINICADSLEFSFPEKYNIEDKKLIIISKK